MLPSSALRDPNERDEQPRGYASVNPPRVFCVPLNDCVARFEPHFLLVQQKHNRAAQDIYVTDTNSSLATTERPCASWPVTTRRIRGPASEPPARPAHPCAVNAPSAVPARAAAEHPNMVRRSSF